MEPPEYRIPPTHAVYSSPKGYEPTQAAPPPVWYDIPSIPPPPPPEPKMRKHRWSIAGFIVLLLGIVSVAVFAGWAGIHPMAKTSVRPTLTPVPTMPARLSPTMQPTPPPTLSGSPYVSDLYSQDFGAFYGAFERAMTAGDYSSVGASTTPSYALTCNTGGTPSCDYSWQKTYMMLRTSHIWFSFPYEGAYSNDSCNIPKAIRAFTYTVVKYSQDGTISSIPISGTAVFGFVNEGIGADLTQWFWDDALLVASC